MQDKEGSERYLGVVRRDIVVGTGIDLSSTQAMDARMRVVLCGLEIGVGLAVLAPELHADFGNFGLAADVHRVILEVVCATAGALYPWPVFTPCLPSFSLSSASRQTSSRETYIRAHSSAPRSVYCGLCSVEAMLSLGRFTPPLARTSFRALEFVPLALAGATAELVAPHGPACLPATTSFEFLIRKPPCNYWINVNYESWLGLRATAAQGWYSRSLALAHALPLFLSLAR